MMDLIYYNEIQRYNVVNIYVCVCILDIGTDHGWDTGVLVNTRCATLFIGAARAGYSVALIR